RKRWEVYTGSTQNDAFHRFKKALKELEIEFQIKKSPPHFMYDDRNERIIISTLYFEIQLIYVSADPLTRAFTRLIGTSKKKDGITLLSCMFEKKSSEVFYKVINKFIQYSPIAPWRITSHPRFQFAVLLQLINKYKWNKVSN